LDQGLLFTVLVPGIVAAYVPYLIHGGHHVRSGFWSIGWAVTIPGALIYGHCLVSFLLSGGTPAIFFSRPLRFVLGEEPSTVVRGGMYRISRNPMYLGVVLAVFGQAILFESILIALYGVLVWMIFHIGVAAFFETNS
jgi:protein-S-isoprenylcysteine O-methyltransferase Ste14